MDAYLNTYINQTTKYLNKLNEQDPEKTNPAYQNLVSQTSEALGLLTTMYAKQTGASRMNTKQVLGK